jgi:hypothetical protein
MVEATVPGELMIFTFKLRPFTHVASMVPIIPREDEQAVESVVTFSAYITPFCKATPFIRIASTEPGTGPHVKHPELDEVMLAASAVVPGPVQHTNLTVTVLVAVWTFKPL